MISILKKEFYFMRKNPEFEELFDYVDFWRDSRSVI